jgi:signal transduction histidine kinase
MKLRLNITPKLTLIFVLFAALLLAMISTLAYTNGQSALESATTAELFATAIEKQSALNAWVTETMTHVASLSASPYLRERMADLLAAKASGNQAEIQATRDRLVAELQIWAGDGMDYLGWMIMDPQSGQIIASTDRGEEGKFREDQPYFTSGKSGPYLQNLYYSPSTLGTLLTVSAPIRSENGALLGVLAGNLNLEKMNAIIARRTGLRQSDEAFLVNTSELFVTQPRLISDPAVLLRGVHTEAVKRCLARNSGVVTAPDYRDVPSMIVYRWLPERQLCLIVKMDRAEALVPVLALRNNIILISILALLAAAALAWWLAQTITRPVRRLAEAAQEIGAGKLDTPIKVNTADEIGKLARAFVEMGENLKKTLVSRDDLLIEVNERKRAEDAMARSAQDLEHSNKELERFAYVASHDLQEPLRMVISYLQLLERRYKDKLDSDALEFINYAVDGSNRMKTLINDLLAFSRVGSRGKEFALVNCEELFARVLNNLQVSIEENKAKVTHDPLPSVIADDTQLESLFQNLIGNAIKFHGSQPPLIHVGVHKDEKNWVFSVSDNGIGIDAQYFERIFIIFQRLHNRQEYGGTGIGLAISKRIVERHGGRIWIESQPEKGSTFFFTIPIKGEKQ